MKCAAFRLFIAGLILALPSEALVRMGLFIGDDRGLAAEKPLAFATRDARGMYATLREYGGLDSARSLLLLNPTRNQLETALSRSAEQASASARRGEAVQWIVYFSGHGSEQGFHAGGRVVPMEDFRAAFKGVEARFKVLIADACYSGALLQAKGGVAAPPLDVRYSEGEDAQGTAFITSSSAIEVSVESKELQGSLFTSYLIRGLRGEADLDRDGSVTLWEAYAFTKARVKERRFGSAGFRQTPYFSEEVRGSDPVVLTRIPGSAPAVHAPDGPSHRLAAKGETSTPESKPGRAFSFGIRLDPYFPERDEPSFQLRAAFQEYASRWGWNLGMGWLQHMEMSNRRYGIEQGYLLAGGILRTWRIGAWSSIQGGLDADFWWVRQVSEGVHTISDGGRAIPSGDFTHWGHMLGNTGSVGLLLPVTDRFSVSLALQGGYSWNPSWPDEWVPTGGVSTSLLIR